VDWIVTLVCGASGVGKSSVARPLAGRWAVPLAEADDVVTALSALTTPRTHPLLHHWSTTGRDRQWTPEELAAHTLAVAESLAPGFRAVIADHVECGAPVVIEGDYLLPDLVSGFEAAARAVVVAEPDEDALVANFAAREPDAGDQRFRARVSVAYGAALVARARAVSAAVVPPRPYADVVDRAERALRG
jgi:2-phosphoglycerate kinase